MTAQLHNLVVQQQIADSHRGASIARLVSGERLGRRRVKPTLIMVLLALCVIALIAGAPARATPQATKAPGAKCQIRLPISMTAGSGHSPGRRYDSSGPAVCTGWLGPWFTSGGGGSASSYGGLMLVTHGARGCVPSAGYGKVFAVVPRQTWFVAPEVTLSGAFRFHRVDGRLQLTGHARLVRTRESPVSARLSLTGNVAFARRAGHPCNSAHVRGTLTLALAVNPV